MYFKLSFRNAKRSFADYLFYMMAMVILLAIMEASNCVSIMGKMRFGFQTASLPILIAVILVILVGYIDAFMLKQRAKEFANYLLLGMGKGELLRMFLLEFFIVGFFCFMAGSLIGFGSYGLFCFAMLRQAKGGMLPLLGNSLSQTFFYFCAVEGMGAFYIARVMRKLQIRELVCEKERSQTLADGDSYRKSWGTVFGVSLLCLAGSIGGIAFLPEYIASPIISIVAAPLLCFIFSFYQCIFGILRAARQKREVLLYGRNRLYMIAQLTSDFKTGAVMNAVLCICLLFSAMSFFFGTMMLWSGAYIFDIENQNWMGFLQISLSVIFFVIYFSVLSLQQIVKMRREAGSIRTLYYLGRSRSQIRKLVKGQIAIRLSMPMILTFALLLFCVPLINRRLNLALPVEMHNILWKSAGGFCGLLCFFCLVYFLVIYAMCWLNIVSKSATIKSVNNVRKKQRIWRYVGSPLDF